ncbi:MAG: aldo/keto reductase [Eubacteriales bacterium]
MQDRIKINDTDLELSLLGLGCVRAGLSWDGLDANNLLEHFIDLNGNFIDTARVYSDWIPGETSRSERVIGDWITYRGHRQDIILATKGGHPSFDSMNVSRLSKAEMRSDIEHSLQKLQTDYIDIYFYHRDDTNKTVEELIDTMETFRKEGKLRYYACSNWTTSRMKEADAYCARMGYRGFVANQALYNIGVKNMTSLSDPTMVVCDQEMLEYHMQSNNLLMPYSSLCNGFFHKLINQVSVENNSHGYHSINNINIANELDALCKKNNYSIAQAMLGFFHVQEIDIVPLFSTSNISHMDEVTKYMISNYNKEDYSFCF